MKIMVIAAHPDDEILGVGATMAKHIANKDKVFVLILGQCIAPNREVETGQIKEHTLNAAKIIGLEKTQVHFADLGVKENKMLDELPLWKLATTISKKVNDLKPDVVYTHHKGDVNTHHQIVFQASMIALRTMDEFIVKKVLCYEIPSSTEQAPSFKEYCFNPNAFVDVGGFIEKKIEAMKEYKTEIRKYPHPRSEEGIAIYAKYRGLKIGVEAAEAFILVREVIR